MAATIASLQLDNFLAFAGPGAQHTLHYGGKNLLIYGENGSGKTAIYRALKGFFALSRPPGEFTNVFEPTAPWAVTLKFVGGKEIRWNAEQHPAWVQNGFDQQTNRTARRSAFLSYRDLAKATGANIFRLLLDSILADYQVPSEGKSQSLGTLLADVRATLPLRHFTSPAPRCQEAANRFSEGLTGALEQLKPHAEAVLANLAADGAAIKDLQFPGLTIKRGHYNVWEIGNQRVTPCFQFRGHEPARAADFFNEALLTALSVAIFLAGRLASVPMGEDVLKLLVLDDVLISLDRSHRLPLLGVLQEQFGDWQIVLMTHDRTWFEIARDHSPGGMWECCELYPAAPGKAGGRPVAVRCSQNRVEELLREAEAFLNGNHLSAAANCARIAFEVELKKICAEGELKVTYQKHGVTAGPLADAVRAKPEGKAALAALDRYQRVVFNPGSHADAELERAEVEGAIEELNRFHSLKLKL